MPLEAELAAAQTALEALAAAASAVAAQGDEAATGATKRAEAAEAKAAELEAKVAELDAQLQVAQAAGSSAEAPDEAKAAALEAKVAELEGQLQAAQPTAAEEGVPPAVDPSGDSGGDTVALEKLHEQIKQLHEQIEQLKASHAEELVGFAAKAAADGVARFLEAAQLSLPVTNLPTAGWVPEANELVQPSTQRRVVVPDESQQFGARYVCNEACTASDIPGGANRPAGLKLEAGEKVLVSQMLTVHSTAGALQVFQVEKVTSGKNKRSIGGYIESQNLAPVPTKYTVLKDTAVREGPETDSKKVETKDTKELAGKTIAVLESVVLPDGKERVRYEAGWISKFTDQLVNVANTTPVREGPDMDSKKVEIKGAKDGKLEAGKTIEILEAVVLPDGKERVRYKAGWISKYTAKGVPILGEVIASEPLLQIKDMLAPEQVSTTVSTDLRELTSAACTWLAEVAGGGGMLSPVHGDWVSTLTDMHAKGTLMDAIGIVPPVPAPVPAPVVAAAAAPSVTINAGIDLKTFLESAALQEAMALFEQQGAAFVSDIAEMT